MLMIEGALGTTEKEAEDRVREKLSQSADRMKCTITGEVTVDFSPQSGERFKWLAIAQADFTLNAPK